MTLNLGRREYIIIRLLYHVILENRGLILQIYQIIRVKLKNHINFSFR